jgi:predicted transcriptional regulator
MSDQVDRSVLLELAAKIVSAHVANNHVDAVGLPALIQSVFDALSGVETTAPVEQALVPAVSIKQSVKQDHIICLEDGKKLKMLKRHLMTAYQMTPEQYRAKWGLPRDYPMVAPDYAERRSALARSIGLGRKPGASPEAPAVAPAPKAAKKTGVRATKPKKAKAA